MDAVDSQSEPLLHAVTVDEEADEAALKLSLVELDVHFKELMQSLTSQGKLAWPLLLQLIATYATGIISLAFVGHLGTQELAAAALGTSFISVLGRTVIMGLNGALDTLASQAFGAGDYAALPVLFQRSVVFLLLHAIPLAALLLSLPRLLASQQAAGETKLMEMASAYLLYLIPNLFLECVYRPLNSTLVSQRISRPQAVVAFLVLPCHIGTNYLFIHVLKFGYLGAAIAMCFATIYSTSLISLYVLISGMSSRVWGKPSVRMFQEWRLYAALAYPACFMRCAESLGFSLVTLLSGLLPNPDTAVAAASVAFNLYGLLYMTFAAFGYSTITLVGNALGTGNAHQAKVAALASMLAAPALWVLLVAPLLLIPSAQNFLIRIFTDSTDPLLLMHLHQLLHIVAALLAFDGAQTILSGVITGTGKQQSGAWINFVAFYILAIPASMLLGFYYKFGVEGMYWGMSLGPLTQLICYLFVISRTRWAEEAERATARIQQQQQRRQRR